MGSTQVEHSSDGNIGGMNGPEFPVTLQVETFLGDQRSHHTDTETTEDQGERFSSWLCALCVCVVRGSVPRAFSSGGESAVLIRLRSLVRIQQGPPGRPEQVFGSAAEPYQVHQHTQRRSNLARARTRKKITAHGECPGAAEPMKDGAWHRKRRGGVLHPVIRRCPNGETPPVRVTREGGPQGN